MQWLEIKEIGPLLKNPIHIKEIKMNLVIKFDFNNMLKIAKFCLTLNTVDPAVKPRDDEKKPRDCKLKVWYFNIKRGDILP